MKKILAAAILILVASTSVQAKHIHKEKWYQNQWCTANNGATECVLQDHTRCDCLTGTHAVEFDFGTKWAESIGQSMYYAIQTGKKAGIVLILEKKSDYKYWVRLNTVIQHYNLNIDTWAIGPGAPTN